MIKNFCCAGWGGARLLRRSVYLLVFLLCGILLPVQVAIAFQIPADGADTWVVTGGVAAKSTPSGVKVSVAVTGAVSITTLNNVTQMSGAGLTPTAVSLS